MFYVFLHPGNRLVDGLYWASEFEDRRTTKTVEDSSMTGFFVDDFSYAELQMLHLKQRLAGRSALFDGLFTIPSFSEIMYVYKETCIRTKTTLNSST